jgi:hypothetical protein
MPVVPSPVRFAVLCVAIALAACGQRVTPVSTPVPLSRLEPIPIGRGSLQSERFGAVFCAALVHLAASGGDWGYCSRYFAPAGTPAAVFPDIVPGASGYRFLVVPGIFGQCLESVARPFEDAARHLRAHGIELEYVGVSALGSTAHNARQINTYLRPRFTAADQRKYISFGYSKGASDLLEAVAADGPARRGIVAVVTIAGSVLGSRLPEGIPRGLVDFLRERRLGSCDVGDGGGVDSLRRSVRLDALARFIPPDGFRAYSIASVSSQAATSNVLLRGWRQLRAYSLEQDSQVIHEDAIVPGGTYLGAAQADHWAVALPIEDVPADHPMKRVLSRAVNHNHYPRVALIEAAIRFVLGDLAGESAGPS